MSLNSALDDDGKVKITEFSQGCCLASMNDPEIDMELRCELCELEYESRQVQFLLDYKDSRRLEYTLTEIATSNQHCHVLPYLGPGFDPEKPVSVHRSEVRAILSVVVF